MLADALDKYIASCKKDPLRITLSHVQYRKLNEEFATYQRFCNIVPDEFGKSIATFKGIPLYADPYISDLKCRFCNKEISEQQFEKEWLQACDEHMIKARMFYLLSIGGKK